MESGEKMRGKLKFIIGILLAITVLTGCGQKTDKVTIVGSSAMQLLAEQAGNDYRLQHKGVNITVQGGGSGTGLSQVQERAVAIGTSDIFAEQKKGINAAQLQDHKIAVIGITPIANKEVGVKNITRTNLQKIFTGKITNWKQVGGHDLPITVINRSKGSGTRTSFESVILPGLVPIKAQEQDSNGAVKKIVASTPGAISYIAFPYAEGNAVQKLAIDGIAPTNTNVKQNKWKLWSYEHMYTQKHPQAQTQAFINYMQGTHVQRDLIPKLGYISVHDMEYERDAQGNDKLVRKGGKQDVG